MTRTITERNALAVANVKLVPWLAKKLMLRYYEVQRIGLEDAVSAGAFGLIRAAEEYDEGHGTEFSGFAVQAIFWSIMRAAQAGGRMTRLSLRSLDEPDRLGRLREPLDYRSDGLSAADRLDLATILGRLEPSDVELLTMHVGEEKTYQEIGERMGLSRQRVHQLVARALERARQVAEV